MQQDIEMAPVLTKSSGTLITLQRKNSEFARISGPLLMTIFAAMIVLPQMGLAAYALASAEFRQALASHPVAALELAAACAFWVGLVCWPLRKIFIALASDRLVDIRDGEVTVVDKNLLSSRVWQMPLMTYEGIAVRLRTSVSGTHHEAVLVHPDPWRSVILARAEHIGRAEALELCRTLGLPLLSACRSPSIGGPTSGGHRTEAGLATVCT
jgi:hypothetical protein